MELFELKNIVLLLVLTGLLIGVGVLALSSFEAAVRTSTTQTDTAKNLSVTGSTSLTKTQCIGLSSIDNGTTSFDLSTYNVTLSSKDTCTISYSAISACSSPKCNVTYTYGVNTTASVAAGNVDNAIVSIPNTWMALIVTVIVLSIVLVLVIRSFSMGGARK